MRKTQLDDFIIKARSIHGTKYNYSRVPMEMSTNNKIEIGCDIHGWFTQKVGDHIHGRNGCNECGKIVRGKTRKLTLEQFRDHIKQFNNNVDVDLITSCNPKDNKFNLKCKIHGDFEILKKSLLVGCTCPGCVENRAEQRFHEVFLNRVIKAEEMHPEYDFTEAKSLSRCESIPLICPVHGQIKMTLGSLLIGCGCSRCGKEATAKRHEYSFEQWLEVFEKVHGQKYLYISFQNKRVTFLCPDHGMQSGLYGDHQQGHGCRVCGKISAMQKVASSAFKFKNFTMPSGAIRRVQGYEPWAMNLLLETFPEHQIETLAGSDFNIPYTFEQKRRRYFPDIKVLNRIIEVKSDYTFAKELDKNFAKMLATVAEGYEFEFWVFSQKGTLSVIYPQDQCFNKYRI